MLRNYRFVVDVTFKLFTKNRSIFDLIQYVAILLIISINSGHPKSGHALNSGQNI